jgi:hypothetical protein
MPSEKTVTDYGKSHQLYSVLLLLASLLLKENEERKRK